MVHQAHFDLAEKMFIGKPFAGLHANTYECKLDL